jgi:nicotinamide-nucleotide amidase
MNLPDSPLAAPAAPAAPAADLEPTAFPGAGLNALLAQLADALRGQGHTLATAESCTGGLIAGACTELAGSSDWFDRGVVSYSNQAKQEWLGVPAGALAAHGAVSEPVARAMVAGLLARSPVHVGVAVTGVAGPGGGSPDKPVGLVWLAWGWRDANGHTVTAALRQQFPGDRSAVRRATIACALQGVLHWARQGDAPEGAVVQMGDAEGATSETGATGATGTKGPSGTTGPRA